MNDALKRRLQRLLRLDLALRFVWRSTPRLTLASLALVIVQGFLPLLPLYLTKLTVDAVTIGLSAPDKMSALGRLALLVILTGVVNIFTSLVGTITSLVNNAQSMIVGDYMQNIVHAKSIAVDLEYYENPKYHDTLRRAQAEAPYRPLQILRGITQLIQSAISLVAVAGLLFALNWGIALALVIVVLPGFLVKLTYSNKLFRWQRERTEAERQAMYFGWLLTGAQIAKEIRLFNLGPLFIQRFRDLRMQLRREQLGLSARQAVAELLAQVFSTVAIYGAYGLVAYQALQGSISLGDLVMYYQAFQRGQGFLQSFLSSLASLYESSLFLTNLYEFLDLEPRVIEPKHPRPMPRPMQSGIVFENVGFSYPTGTREVLRCIDLTIRPGEKIALVGANGSGKSTLIKLLCRLYDPQSGQITIDGIDLREISITGLRQEISVILQDYAQYNLTAQENIWFGDVSRPPDNAQIVSAAQQAGIHEVLGGLKNGYETVLGKMFQDGEELSIGEWQKVALARAFLRNAQIIVMDEPTSAMDARAEYEFFERLQHLAAQQTVILISHRFSTVRMADRIYVLRDGEIMESGSHDELMAQHGTYAQLFEMQARHYQLDRDHTKVGNKQP